MSTAVGIDLGATAICAVKLEGTDGLPSVADVRVFVPDDLDKLEQFCDGASAVAIDAPAMLSTYPHGDDEDLPPKFRPARCCEVASLKVAGVPAVPWITPLAGAEVSGWMHTGFRVWEALSSHAPMEVYPHACFYRLNGGKQPVSKQKAEGRLERVGLLRSYVELPVGAEVWSHDGLDAAVAALVAHQGRDGAVQVPHECTNFDGSELWVPA
jgi:predicted nuclease with RNAse H fold